MKYGIFFERISKETIFKKTDSKQLLQNYFVLFKSGTFSISSHPL